MKAIILAAGQGTRLKKYTENLPKGMLDFQGKTIIERQIEMYRLCGMNNITVIRGFAADKIAYEGVKYYFNKDFEITNMVESFLTAKDEFDDDIILSYSDILFSQKMLRTMMNSDEDSSVAVDVDWKKYWQMRYGKVDFDTESLKVNDKGYITSLGLENPPVDEIDARYVGLLKFSKKALMDIYLTIAEKDLFESDLLPARTPQKNILSAIEYIHTNFSRKIYIDHLAELTGYSTAYFESFFKAYMGKTPSEYIVLYRLDTAKRLLAETDMSVTEIAQNCGFANVSYFIRSFRRAYRTTPYGYRKN